MGRVTLGMKFGELPPWPQLSLRGRQTALRLHFDTYRWYGVGLSVADPRALPLCLIKACPVQRERQRDATA